MIRMHDGIKFQVNGNRLYAVEPYPPPISGEDPKTISREEKVQTGTWKAGITRKLITFSDDEYRLTPLGLQTIAKELRDF